MKGCKENLIYEPIGKSVGKLTNMTYLLRFMTLLEDSGRYTNLCSSSADVATGETRHLQRRPEHHR